MSGGLPSLAAGSYAMKALRTLTLAILALTLVPLTAARAQSLTVNYYEIAESDQDANNLTFGTVDNEVQNTLGPNGLPVLNTPQYGCTSNCFDLTGPYPRGMPQDVLSNGEITYWSPALNNGGPDHTSDVTFTGTGTLTLPVCVTTCEGGNFPQNFFPPNGTGSSDYYGFQAATLTGTLVVPKSVSSETLSFEIGADDMAFAFLNGQEVCDLGGVHAATAGTCVAPFAVGPGSYSLEVFFVDLNVSQAGLYFNVLTSGVTVSPTGPTTVPEPATLTLFGASLLGLGLRRRRGHAARTWLGWI
jgi:hypothetical protein